MKSRYCIEYSLTVFNLYMVLTMNRLAQKVSWELLVSRLKTYCHSHVIIQSLNIYSLHWHYYDMQHDHNLYKHYLQETRVEKHLILIKQNTIIYLSFDNYDNITVHDNNVTLQSYETMACTKSEFIVHVFCINFILLHLWPFWKCYMDSSL